MRAVRFSVGLIGLVATVNVSIAWATEPEAIEPLEEIQEQPAPDEDPLIPDLAAPKPADSPADDSADQSPTAPPSAPAPAERPKPPVTFGGYVDFGFFVPSGNGAGFFQHSGPLPGVPEANRYSWVFLGDIMAPAVNSRGEPADLGDPSGVQRYDSVDSNGAMGFIVNEVNLAATAGIGRSILATSSVNFTPRSGANFALGDAFDVDMAQIEWLPSFDPKASIFVGKFNSVVGIEYRERKASQRFGITPSLLARYTTGTPLGIKLRKKFGVNDRLILAAALTNGSSVTEAFHFYDEVDSNDGKTASGRVAVRPLPVDLEIGLSGLYGPQDRALDSRDAIWFYGVDLLAHLGPVDLKGQWLRGHAPGESDRRYDERHRPYGLDLHGGAYLEADVMLTPYLGLLGRGEYRDAKVWLGNPQAPEGADRLYLTKSWRATLGARIVVNESLVAKAEYLRNGEYGVVPNIRNDVFTTSLVWVY
jgi:hypothetical protein